MRIGLGAANVGVELKVGVTEGEEVGGLPFGCVPNWTNPYVPKATTTKAVISKRTTTVLATAFSFKILYAPRCFSLAVKK